MEQREPTLEIESSDVVRVVLQFLKENNLTGAMQALQKESGVTLNTVDNVENFAKDIRNGRWVRFHVQVL